MFQKDIASILIVEDEPNARALMGRLAERYSNSVFFAQNGKEGLELYQKHRPEIVITDIKMPLVNGLDMIEKIEQLEGRRPIVILATAYSEAEYFIRAIELKVDHLLIKPIDAEVLSEKISKSIQNLEASSENKRLKALLEMQAKKIDTIFDFQNNIVFLCNGSEIKDANLAFLEFFGFASLEEFKKHYSTIQEFFLPCEGFFSKELGKNFIEEVTQSKEKGLLVKMFDKQKDADSIFALKAALYPDGDGMFIISLTDISEIENNKKLLKELATTDNLTKTYNRFKFDEILSVEISRARRYKTALSLIRLEIDQLDGSYNVDYFDNCETLLVELVAIAKSIIRVNDSFARIGFNEFAIILPNTSLDNGCILAEKIRQSITSHTFSTSDKLTVSIGTVEYMANESDDELFCKAGFALKEAKGKSW